MPEIYYTNKNDTARYVMGDFDRNPLCVIGINPSKATLDKLDVTVSKVRKFAHLLGFDGWLMLNIYPQRSTNPQKIHRRRNRQYSEQNCLYIKNTLADLPAPTIWAAWGNLIETRPYFKDCLTDIYTHLQSVDPRWIHLGSLTKSGHPRHPSRMAYDTPVYDFDMDEYLK